MDDGIAYCGLVCDGCAIYLATREKNEEKRCEMRAEIAQQINDLYKESLTAEDITDCDGCKTEGRRLFSVCSTCQIRKCARQKGFENCAHCSEYACEKLAELFVTDPEAKKRLDKIRSGV